MNQVLLTPDLTIHYLETNAKKSCGIIEGLGIKVEDILFRLIPLGGSVFDESFFNFFKKDLKGLSDQQYISLLFALRNILIELGLESDVIKSIEAILGLIRFYDEHRNKTVTSYEAPINVSGDIGTSLPFTEPERYLLLNSTLYNLFGNQEDLSNKHFIARVNALIIKNNDLSIIDWLGIYLALSVLEKITLTSNSPTKQTVAHILKSVDD